MKKLLLPAVIVSLAFLTSLPSHAQLTVTNGNFEAGSDGVAGDGTGSFAGWSANGGLLGITGALAGGGTSAAALETSTSFNAYLIKNIGVATTSGTMTFSFDAATYAGDVPTSNADEDGSLLFRIEQYPAGGGPSNLFTDVDVQASQLNSLTYTTITGSFTTIAGDSYQIDFYAFPINGNVAAGDATAGTYLLDNVSIPAASVPEPTSLALMVAGSLVLLGGRRFLQSVGNR